MEKLKEENLRCKATSEESMRRATSMMMGGQASLVIREAFTGCIDVLAQLMQEHEGVFATTHLLEGLHQPVVSAAKYQDRQEHRDFMTFSVQT